MAKLIRILVYEGPQQWLDATTGRLAVPLNGRYAIDPDKTITSYHVEDATMVGAVKLVQDINKESA